MYSIVSHYYDSCSHSLLSKKYVWKRFKNSLAWLEIPDQCRRIAWTNIYTILYISWDCRHVWLPEWWYLEGHEFRFGGWSSKICFNTQLDPNDLIRTYTGCRVWTFSILLDKHHNLVIFAYLYNIFIVEIYKHMSRFFPDDKSSTIEVYSWV